MKKSLLALAVLGAFAGTASAQSSVTIYGSIDLAIAKGNDGTSANPGTGSGATALSNKAYQMIQSHGSRLGFRGTEDLGGGLSAQFNIEHRFNPDTGLATSTSFWTQTYVQLTSASAGSVYLGRWYTPTFLLANRLDPFGWDGVGQVGNFQYANYSQPDSAGTATLTPSVANVGVRTSNTVGYRTPNLGGFVVTGAVSLSEATGNGRVNSVTGTYGAGPIFVGLGIERVSKGSFDGHGMYQLGGSYDLGVTKLLGYFVRSSYGANGNTHAKGINIGAVTPIGGGNLKAVYARVDPDGANNLRQKIGLGYDYFLSKRTNVYLDLGSAKEDTKTRSSAVAAGIRHDF